MANSGCHEEAQASEELFMKNFSPFDHIVSAGLYDPVEFLNDILQVREVLGELQTFTTSRRC
jgi:hypothetical protein